MNNVNGFNAVYNLNTFIIQFTSNSPFSIDLTQSNFYKLISLTQQIYNSFNVNNLYQINTGIVVLNNPTYINLNIQNITTDNIIYNNQSTSSGFIIPIESFNFGDVMVFNKQNYDMILSVNE